MKISSFMVCDSNSLEYTAGTGSSTTDKRVWSFPDISQQIEILAHIACCYLGSNYPKRVELCSPKLNAYNSYSGPLLTMCHIHGDIVAMGDLQGHCTFAIEGDLQSHRLRRNIKLPCRRVTFYYVTLANRCYTRKVYALHILLSIIYSCFYV